MAVLEVGGHDRPVLFLPSSVPDVQFGSLVFECDVFDFEVDCGYLGFFFGQEAALCETPEERGLTYVAVSHDDNFITLLVLVIREISLLNHCYSLDLINYKSNQTYIPVVLSIKSRILMLRLLFQLSRPK